MLVRTCVVKCIECEDGEHSPICSTESEIYHQIVESLVKFSQRFAFIHSIVEFWKLTDFPGFLELFPSLFAPVTEECLDVGLEMLLSLRHELTSTKIVVREH